MREWRVPSRSIPWSATVAVRPSMSPFGEITHRTITSRRSSQISASVAQSAHNIITPRSTVVLTTDKSNQYADLCDPFPRQPQFSYHRQGQAQTFNQKVIDFGFIAMKFIGGDALRWKRQLRRGC